MRDDRNNTKYIENKNEHCFLLIILFIYYAINFLRTEGNTRPIPATLFNLIIILALLVLLLNKKNILSKRNKILKQTSLDYYFNK